MKVAAKPPINEMAESISGTTKANSKENANQRRVSITRRLRSVLI